MNSADRNVKESEYRKTVHKTTNVAPTAASFKSGKPVTREKKKYLPSSAFTKAVKSSTTKSLLKFRHRQEQQQLKNSQQYKSYQRMMKREGYEPNDSKSGKRHRGDVSINNDDGKDNDDDTKIFCATDNDQIKLTRDAPPNLEKAKSEKNRFPSDATYDEEQLPAISMENKVDGKMKKSDVKGVRTGSSNSGDLQGRNSQFQSRNTSTGSKKRLEEHEQQQRRDDEYKQRQIQIEREKKERLRHRQQRHKLLSARTSKGQPIMKNIAMDILQKLQREQQQQQQQQQESSSATNRR